MTKDANGNPLQLIVPATSDPAKLALYAAGRPGRRDSRSPAMARVVIHIPANLLDPNAVLFMGTGAIPKPNTANGTQYIASPKQPTDVREDVVRIDQHFNDKYQLMGHWIHDQMEQTIYPDMWSNNSYVTTGDVFKNPTWGTVIKLTQTLSPTLLNETCAECERKHHRHHAGRNLSAARPAGAPWASSAATTR